ncbi:MAG: nucleotidyltransferase family protein [Thermoleophilia bacterium]|nr:nucleotidyltransferase family protein [Thermoleophilia bacterium]
MTKPTTWHPDTELALVILCARPRACAAGPATLACAAARVTDWDRFFELALWHGLLPLVNQSHQERPFLPEPVATRFAEAARTNVIRSLRYSAALLRVIDRLEADGMPVVALKGPVLAAQVYGDPALRSFVDLDILIREEHLRTALASLRILGYEPGLPGDETGRHSLRARQHSVLHHALSNITLEVHWRLARANAGVRMHTDDVFSRAEPVPLLGRVVRSLTPSDQFLYLAVHAANDGWNQLEHLRTLGEMVTQHPATDWHAQMERAWSLGIGRRVYIAARLLQMLEVRWDDQILTELSADGGAGELAKQAQSAWGAMRPREPGAPGAISAFVQSLDTHRARARYAVRVALEADEVDLATFRLPRQLYPLYYVLRPSRLAVRSAKRLLRSVRSASHASG